MSTFNSSFALPALILQVALGGVLATAVGIELLDGRLSFLIATAIYIATMGWWFTYTLIARTTQFSLVHVFSFMTAVFFGAKASTAWDEEVEWFASLSDYTWILVLSQVGLIALLAGAKTVERYIGGSSLVDWVSRLAQNVNRTGFGVSFLTILLLQIIGYVILYRSGLFLQQFGAPDIERSYWITSLNMIYPSIRVIGLTMAVTLAWRGTHRLRLFGYVVMAGELLFAFVSGRGTFVESAMLCFVIVVLLNFGRPSMRRHTLVGIILLVLCAGIAWPVYQHVRITASPYFAYNPFEDKVSAMFEHVIPEAMETFDWATVYAPTSTYRQNLVARLGGVDFPAAILDSQSRGASYMYGDAVKTSVSLWIPRYFWPSKPNLNEEEAVIDHYELVDTDQTSSLLGFALADFGILGVVAYLFAFGVLLRMFEVYASKNRTPLLALMAFALFFPLTMSIEGDITRIGAILRVWLVLLVVDFAIFTGRPGLSIARKAASPAR